MTLDKLIILSTCQDGACCCFPPRSSVALISVLSMVVCMIDMLTFESSAAACCSIKQYAEGARHVLTLLFQVANVLLIVSTVMENATLANIYIWYALSYVVLGLCLSILELLCRIVHEGEFCVVVFGCEVIFYFVISRCLPIVNSYKLLLDECASRNTCQ